MKRKQKVTDILPYESDLPVHIQLKCSKVIAKMQGEKTEKNTEDLKRIDATLSSATVFTRNIMCENVNICCRNVKLNYTKQENIKKIKTFSCC